MTWVAQLRCLPIPRVAVNPHFDEELPKLQESGAA